MPRFRLLFVLTLAVGALAVVATVTAAGPQRTSSTPEALGKAIERAQPFRGALVTPRTHQCVVQQIACGQTVTSTLTDHDCALDDGTFVDFFAFAGQAGETATIDLSSNAFDPFLFLLDPTPEVVATDDDGGPGNSARIVHTLDQTSPDWVIAVNNLMPGQLGPYTLALQCQPAAGGGFFSDPGYPDFLFRVEIGNLGSEILGQREPGCLSETVCVSGALPGRSELFLRILGPRPNGYLWPTIVRFTPSRVVVDIRQVSTGQTNRYTLDAVPPGVDDLSGLQDRMGFLP